MMTLDDLCDIYSAPVNRDQPVWNEHRERIAAVVRALREDIDNLLYDFETDFDRVGALSRTKMVDQFINKILGSDAEGAAG